MSSCHTHPHARRAAASAIALVLAATFGAAPQVRAQGAVPAPAGPALSPAAAGAANVQLWHAAARDAIARTKPNQQAALRLLAYLSLAQHEAAQGLQSAVASSNESAWAAAFDRASAGILASLVPALAPTWDGLANSLAAARGDEEADAVITQAKAIGADAARRAAARAAADGFDAAWTGSVPVTAGSWTSQLQPARPPHLPLLGSMKTIFIASGDALRPAAPPQPGSDAFVAALAEVRGRATSGNAAGLARAKRWEMTGGSLVAGFWDATAADLARREGLSGQDTARALALTMGATMDANIACHQAKYTHWVPRPSQADSTIKTLVGLPNHPSYPSNHSCDSMAAATVLGTLFPRHKATLEAMAREAGESRIDAGIHYRFDVEAGEAIGRGAAAAALRADRTAVAEQRQ
jgi:membrane-associated phospholipid phosphatase